MTKSILDQAYADRARHEREVLRLDYLISFYEADRAWKKWDKKGEYVEDWTMLEVGAEYTVVIIRPATTDSFVMEYARCRTDPNGKARYLTMGSNFTAIGANGEKQKASKGIKVGIWKVTS